MGALNDTGREPSNLTSLNVTYFLIYERGSSRQIGVAGTDGSKIAYIASSPALNTAIQDYLKQMQEGLHVRVDDTDHFLLSSLKENIDLLSHRHEFITSELRSRRGKLDKIVEQVHEKQ
jgi:hypothetical protein